MALLLSTISVFLVYCVFLTLGGVKNVLFVIVDDLRTVSYNNSPILTPNIDKFREKSVVFTNAFAQMALCAPSRNSLLTSRRPDSLHLYDFYSYWRTFAGNYTTLPQYLKNFGYDTYSIGKVFHPGKTSNFTDDWPYSWSEPAWHPPTEDFENTPVCVSKSGVHADLLCPVRLDQQPGKTLPDIESASEAIRFLRARNNTERPLFLAVGFHKPHVPFRFPENYSDFYPLENISLPGVRQKPEGMPDIAWNPWNDIRKRDDISSLNVSFPYGPFTDIWAKRIRQAYFASVTYIDTLFGKILSALETTNLDKNTAVVFLGDHGWSLGEHGEWAKFSNFDVALRVPVMIKIRNLTNGSERSELIELVDIFPTLVDILNLPSIPNCNGNSSKTCTEGKSLLPLILGKPINEKPAFSQYPRPGLHPTQHPNSDRPELKDIKYMGYSVRTQKHRYTIWTSWRPFCPDWSKTVAVELYDHTTDPEENHNIAGSPENRLLITALHKTLLEHLKR